MLIFVQVYMTIDKSFEIINRFWKNKRDQRYKQKRNLKAFEENCSWSQSAPENKALLKWWHVIKSEFIRSWSSSEVSSSEAENHQKLQFIRRCKLKVSKAVQWIHYRLSIAKEWKRRATTNSKALDACSFVKRWQSTIVRSVQPLPPLHRVCLWYKTRITALPATMFLHTWNAFEIDPS